MNSILRGLYIVVGPFLAFTIGSLLVCSLAIKLIPDDPMQEQLTTSLNNYIDANSQNIVYVFNNNVFVTSKPIENGQTIEAGDLRRQDYGNKHISHPRVNYLNEHVSGQIAARDIPKGTTLSPKDFAPLKSQGKPASERDESVLCVGHQENPLTWVFFIAAIIGGLSGLIAVIIGYFWVLIEAFKKSVAWGLGSIFIPFCKSVFEFKNWENARRPLALIVIGMFLLSAIPGGIYAWGQQQKISSTLAFSLKRGDLIARLEEKGKVVACIKNVKEGQPFRTEDLEEREIEVARIPKYAVTSASLIVGRRARSAVAAGQLISKDDLQR